MYRNILKKFKTKSTQRNHACSKTSRKKKERERERKIIK